MAHNRKKQNLTADDTDRNWEIGTSEHRKKQSPGGHGEMENCQNAKIAKIAKIEMPRRTKIAIICRRLDRSSREMSAPEMAYWTMPGCACICGAVDCYI
jgi:hypothetical protein